MSFDLMGIEARLERAISSVVDDDGRIEPDELEQKVWPVVDQIYKEQSIAFPNFNDKDILSRYRLVEHRADDILYRIMWEKWGQAPSRDNGGLLLSEGLVERLDRFLEKSRYTDMMGQEISREDDWWEEEFKPMFIGGAMVIIIGVGVFLSF